MSMGRTKQLVAEIAASLAKGAPHPEATPADWKKLIADIKQRFYAVTSAPQKEQLQEEYKAAQLGLRAAEQAAAKKPTFLTGTNLFALKEQVVEHGPEFPGRVPSVDAPHIKRALAAGYAEVVGSKLRLTPVGRSAVIDLLEKDIARERSYTPRESALVSADKRAEILARDRAVHEAKIRRLEVALARLA